MMTSKAVKGSTDSAPKALSRDQWRVESTSAGMALFANVAHHLLISEQEAIDLIDFGSIQIDRRQERDPRRKLAGSERIEVNWPWHGTRRFYEIDCHRIVYRDQYILAYDKEAGIPSQQTPSDGYNNLFAALHRYLQKTTVAHPYVALHQRLDRDTSGIMLFAIDRSANRKLGLAFGQHRIVKDYLAWVTGRPPAPSWKATEDIGRKGGRYCTLPRGKGKRAETSFQVIHQDVDRTLLWARPLTGRTHQIRLHLAGYGLPVLGDRLYDGSPAERLFLHAHRIQFTHPISGASLTVCANIPPEWPPPHTVALPD